MSSDPHPAIASGWMGAVDPGREPKAAPIKGSTHRPRISQADLDAARAA